MNSFTTIDAAFYSLMSDVLVNGQKLNSRVGECTEVIGRSFKLTDIRYNYLNNSRRKLRPNYSAAEILWFFARTNNIDIIEPHAPTYAKYTDDGKNANGSYGGRWKNNPGFSSHTPPGMPDCQLATAFKLLKEKPDTRQAIVTLWDSKDLVSATYDNLKDIPCALALQFFLRDGALHMVANVRSNDLWLGFPYDVFTFTTIQQIMAIALGVKFGEYTHNIGSAHIYERHMRQARESLSDFSKNTHNIVSCFDKHIYSNKYIENKKACELIINSTSVASNKLLLIEERFRKSRDNCDDLSKVTTCNFTEDDKQYFDTLPWQLLLVTTAYLSKQKNLFAHIESPILKTHLLT